jgi:DDE superfamily endonuclease
VDIHLILDNHGTHKTPSVKRWFDRHPEYHLHFTPSSESKLNQVERFFGKITEKQIRRGAFRSVPALEKAIMEYLAHSQRESSAVRVDRRCGTHRQSSPAGLRANF